MFISRRRMSEVSVQKLKLLVAKVRATNPPEDDSIKDSSEDKDDTQSKEAQDDTQSKEAQDDQDSQKTQDTDSIVEKKKVSLFGELLRFNSQFYIHWFFVCLFVQKKGSIFSMFKSKNKSKRKKGDTASQGEDTASQAEPSLGEPSSQEQSPITPQSHKTTDSSKEDDFSKLKVRIDPVVQELKGAKVKNLIQKQKTHSVLTVTIAMEPTFFCYRM